MATSPYRLCVFNSADREAYASAFLIVDEPSSADCHVLDGDPALLSVLIGARATLMAINPSFKPPPVIFATGRPDVLALAAELKAPTITKPFHLDELVELVEAVVNWTDERRKMTFFGDKEH